MTQTHFDMMSELVESLFGRKPSQETYEAFMKYCERGVMETGVKTVVNPINLYAFGVGLSSEEANLLWYERRQEKRREYETKTLSVR